MVSAKVKVINPQGMHMRPAQVFVAEMAKYNSDVTIVFGGKNVNAKSIMHLMAACIKQGSELEASEGSAALGICYSTDSWHQVFGELIQSYITGSADKDATCAAIEEQWAAIDGAE